MSKTSERRAARAARRRPQQPQQWWQNRNLWIAGGVTLLLIIGVIGFNVFTRGTAANPESSGTPASLATLSVPLGVEQSVPSMGAQHVPVNSQHAKYNSTPPTSGPHYDTPASWGKYDNGLPEETWVHDMEHGGVVFLYNCPQACPDLTSKLEALLKDRAAFSKYGYAKFIIMPYSKIPNKLTLVAWSYYLPLGDYDDALVRKFIRDHQDKGPEDVG